MSWPFPEYLRPIMRSYLWYISMGYDPSEARERLIGPPNHLRPGDVDRAIPEAERSRLFREALAAAPPGQSLAETWRQCAGSCFAGAYGRMPTEAETAWAYSQPQQVLGLMFEATVPATEQHPERTFPVTVNAPWDFTLEMIRDQVAEDLALEQIPYSPPSQGEIDPRTLQLELIGGALVQRIEPTITLTAYRDLPTPEIDL